REAQAPVAQPVSCAFAQRGAAGGAANGGGGPAGPRSGWTAGRPKAANRPGAANTTSLAMLPAVTGSTTIPHAPEAPSGPRRAAAGPLAAVAIIRQSPGDPRPATAVAIASPPENQAADGGSSSVASRRSSFSRATASAFSNAAMYSPSSARACGPVGSATWSG